MTSPQPSTAPTDPSAWQKIKSAFFTIAEAMDGDGPEELMLQRIGQLEQRVSELEMAAQEAQPKQRFAAAA